MENNPGQPKRREGIRAATSENNYIGRRRTDTAVRLARLSLRLFHFAYRHFDGDLAQAIVLGEVAVHNVLRLQQPGSNAVDADKLWNCNDLQNVLLPCNALSISQSTGIPRETVRRKIAKLVKKGWMEQNTKGEVIITQAVCLKFVPELNNEMLNTVLTAGNDIRDLTRKSPVKVVPQQKDRSATRFPDKV
jgi:hypothetical protein